MLSNVLTLILLAASAVAAPVVTIQERATCPDVLVYYARGTFESKPIGGEIGQTFNTTLAAALAPKTLLFQGIDYPANVFGFLAGGDSGGTTTLYNSVVGTAADCPDTKIVMAGYSQGAQLVHDAAAKLPTSVQQRVNAVVTFGDPDSSSALPPILEARRKTFCNDGDYICSGTILITWAHTQYAQAAPAAAAFVVAHV